MFVKYESTSATLIKLKEKADRLDQEIEYVVLTSEEIRDLREEFEDLFKHEGEEAKDPNVYGVFNGILLVAPAYHSAKIREKAERARGLL